MNIRVARGQKECLSQGALSDDTEWTALPNLVQLHFSTNLLILWNYREGGSNTLVKDASDEKEWTAVPLCHVNEQHSLCW